MCHGLSAWEVATSRSCVHPRTHRGELSITLLLESCLHETIWHEVIAVITANDTAIDGQRLSQPQGRQPFQFHLHIDCRSSSSRRPEGQGQVERRKEGRRPIATTRRQLTEGAVVTRVLRPRPRSVAVLQGCRDRLDDRWLRDPRSFEHRSVVRSDVARIARAVASRGAICAPRPPLPAQAGQAILTHFMDVATRALEVAVGQWTTASRFRRVVRCMSFRRWRRWRRRRRTLHNGREQRLGALGPPLPTVLHPAAQDGIPS